MQYNLNSDQISEIKESYCRSKKVIDEVAGILNGLDLPIDEDDFMDIVINVVSQYESIKMQVIASENKNSADIQRIPNNIKKKVEEEQTFDEMLYFTLRDKFSGNLDYVCPDAKKKLKIRKKYDD